MEIRYLFVDEKNSKKSKKIIKLKKEKKIHKILENESLPLCVVVELANAFPTIIFYILFQVA